MDRYPDIILFFSIYSFMGWVLETCFASINGKKIINRGFLGGPFCTIYGFGAVMIIQVSLLLKTAFANYFITFIINMLLSVLLITVLEYFTGLLLMKVFNRRWWDYSNNFANLQGYICFQYSLLWGILAFVLLQVVHPSIIGIVNNMQGVIKSYSITFLLLYFLADIIISVINTLYLKDDALYYSSKY